MTDFFVHHLLHLSELCVRRSTLSLPTPIITKTLGTSLLICVWGLTGCSTEIDLTKSQKTHAQSEQPPLIDVRAERKDLLFRYTDKEGAEQSAVTVDEIPKEFRAHVQVINLSQSPAERNASGYLQIFDLTTVNVDGSYPGRVILRRELESVLARAQALPEQTPITMYSTSWCGVCKKARMFMKKRGLAFIEKDIEKDKQAAKELQEKSRRAGVSLGGVPVIDIGGQLMKGFDPERLLTLAQSPPKNSPSKAQPSLTPNALSTPPHPPSTK